MRGQATVTERAAAGVFRKERPAPRRRVSLQDRFEDRPLTPMEVEFLALMQRRMLAEEPCTWPQFAKALGRSERATCAMAFRLRCKLNRFGPFALQAFCATTKCTLLLQQYHDANRAVAAIRAQKSAPAS